MIRRQAVALISLAALFALALSAALSTSCSSPPSDARVILDAPDRATFAPVSDMLDQRCGTLDCHGVPQRNLRLYGHLGLRLDPASQPIYLLNTTPAEYDASYLSVVGLEPEAMNEVVSQGGANPLRLSLLRKPLGIENHKGGTLMQMGDTQYTCVTSWLAGNTDTASCVSAQMTNP